MAGLAIQAVSLRLAIRSRRLEREGLFRPTILVGIRFLATIGVWAGLAAFDDEAIRIAGLAAAILVADVAVMFPLLRFALGIPFRDVRRIWVMQFAGSLVAWVVVFGIASVCLGVAEIPNSSMSPNIRGFHVVETLPGGHHLVIAANTPGDESAIPPGKPSGSLVAETYEYTERPRPTRQADVFLWNKTIKPQRWDAVVFSHANRPEDKFVKRLVGLPGEQIEIREGMVWVDGQQLEPPAKLGPIRYLPGLDSPQEQWVLGPDECFLLGDNTEHCADSRYFGPVRLNEVRGVVTAIYWPPARWRENP